MQKRYMVGVLPRHFRCVAGSFCCYSPHNVTRTPFAVRAHELHAFHAPDIPLPAGHQFPWQRYQEACRQLTSDVSLQGTVFIHPAPLATPEELRLVHHDEYVGQVLDGTLPLPKLRKIGFAQAAPADFVASSRGIAGSAIAATRLVLHSGARITGCISGGTHHAHASFGAGFCVFNDCAIAAAVALQDGAVSRVLVVDLDVHQGNGTAAIFADDPRVFTFSMHQRRGYPQVDRARSDLDLELEDGTGDDRYLGCLRNALPRLLDDFRPQLIVYQSGVDPLEGDLLGRLAMSREGLRQRNALVFAEALARTIPLIITFGGGYQRDRSVAVAAHVDVYRQAAAMLRL